MNENKNSQINIDISYIDFRIENLYYQRYVVLYPTTKDYISWLTSLLGYKD